MINRAAGSLAIVMMVTILAGCSSTPESKETPCEQCDYGYVPVRGGKSVERRVWCVKDGKTLDCAKTPAECPQCRRILEKESRYQPPAK